MNELSPRDRELADTLRRTLDMAAARPDPQVDAALAATRAQAAAVVLASRWRSPLWVMAGSLAVAASLATIVIMPHLAGRKAAEPVAVEAAAMPAEDPQFLEDMEMLSVLGEDHRES